MDIRLILSAPVDIDTLSFMTRPMLPSAPCLSTTILPVFNQLHEDVYMHPHLRYLHDSPHDVYGLRSCCNLEFCGVASSDALWPATSTCPELVVGISLHEVGNEAGLITGKRTVTQIKLTISGTMVFSINCQWCNESRFN